MSSFTCPAQAKAAESGGPVEIGPNLGLSIERLQFVNYGIRAAPSPTWTTSFLPRSCRSTSAARG